jgi:hypothetical protein
MRSNSAVVGTWDARGLLRRREGMVAKAALLLALVALLAGCGGHTASPRFQPAAGWHLLGAHGELVAANVPFAPADRSLESPPFHTVASLSRRGTLIWLVVMPRGRAIYAKSPVLPLRVDNGLPSDTPDGAPCAPAVHCLAASDAIRYMRVHFSQGDLAVTIFFGTDHPSATQVRAANAELARLSL